MSYREKARTRAGNECERCGVEGSASTDDLQVHHITAVEDGGTDDLPNLAVVCNSCHWQIHRKGPNSQGEYPIELANGSSFDDSEFVNPQLELTNCQKAILARMEPRGAMARKEILEGLDYSAGHFVKCMQRLRIAGWVDRKGRGLYELVDDPRTNEE